MKLESKSCNEKEENRGKHYWKWDKIGVWQQCWMSISTTIIYKTKRPWIEKLSPFSHIYLYRCGVFDSMNKRKSHNPINSVSFRNWMAASESKKRQWNWRKLVQKHTEKNVIKKTLTNGSIITIIIGSYICGRTIELFPKSIRFS